MTSPALAAGLSEAAFQQQVLDLAAAYQWTLRYHTFDSRHSTAGFPDLVLCRPPELLVVELKAQRGRVSSDQVEWLGALEACGIETVLWRPSDWPDIEARLKRRCPARRLEGRREELLIGAATLLGVEVFARSTAAKLAAGNSSADIVHAALLTVEAQCAQARSEIRSVDPTRPGGVPA